MSGFLRRIKRSRPADAGEPLPEGQAAAPEGATPATEPATAVTEPVVPEPQPQPEPKTASPVLLADPDTPAGVDPAAAPLRPPAGRRGRLRRRLRYLRRARELMLRDLGGLLYEVHRTGGGNVEAHGNIVRAKVQRIAGLDAEAHALETALATSRPEAVVFQPGVGGACTACGEYYGSAARFCSNCGAPITGAALPAPVQDPTAAPAPATRESVFGRPAQPTQGLSSGDPLRASAASAPVARGATHEPSTGDETAAVPSASAREPDPSAQTSMFQAPGSDGPAAGDSTAVPPSVAERRSGDASPAAAQRAGSRDESAAVPGAPDEAAASEQPGAVQPSAGDDPAALAHGASDQPTASDLSDAHDHTGASNAEAAASDEPAEHGAPAASGEPAERDETAARDHPAAVEPGTRDEPAPGDAATGSDPQDDTGRNPFARLRNGRSEEDHAPPELSSGDPLATRETRS